MVAVYPVPDPVTGDMVMAAIEMQPSATFDAAAFDAFLAEQKDLGTKWSPRLVRLIPAMSLTANNKVHKPPLRLTKWQTDDAIYWRPQRQNSLQVMTSNDKAALEELFAANSRQHLLTGL